MQPRGKGVGHRHRYDRAFRPGLIAAAWARNTTNDNGLKWRQAHGRDRLRMPVERTWLPDAEARMRSALTGVLCRCGLAAIVAPAGRFRHGQPGFHRGDTRTTARITSLRDRLSDGIDDMGKACNVGARGTFARVVSVSVVLQTAHGDISAPMLCGCRDRGSSNGCIGQMGGRCSIGTLDRPYLTRAPGTAMAVATPGMQSQALPRRRTLITAMAAKGSTSPRASTVHSSQPSSE